MTLLVAIEGIDGSGKGTQSALLCEHLQKRGHTACVLSFPRYQQTWFGAAIGDFLNGRFGSLADVHPQLASLLFAGDRYESKDVILGAAAEHDVVIFDRYVASNIAHQAAKLDEPQRSQLMEWITTIEHDVYQIPRPDLCVLLDLSVSAAQTLIAAKAKRTYTDKSADLQEADADYLKRVREVYLKLANESPDWECIDCLTEESIRSTESIAADLETHVLRRIQDQPGN